MPRPAHLNAHAQLCRCCGAKRPANEFGRGDSFCADCRLLIGPLTVAGESARTSAPHAPVNIVSLRAKAAMAKHESNLDAALEALFTDGGFDAAYFGAHDAMKRLALAKRDKLGGGWIV